MTETQEYKRNTIEDLYEKSLWKKGYTTSINVSGETDGETISVHIIIFSKQFFTFERYSRLNEDINVFIEAIKSYCDWDKYDERNAISFRDGDKHQTKIHITLTL